MFVSSYRKLCYFRSFNDRYISKKQNFTSSLAVLFFSEFYLQIKTIVFVSLQNGIQMIKCYVMGVFLIAYLITIILVILYCKWDSYEFLIRFGESYIVWRGLFWGINSNSMENSNKNSNKKSRKNFNKDSNKNSKKNLLKFVRLPFMW